MHYNEQILWRINLQLFELIISVSGIGPKIGLAIVGSASAEAITAAIRNANVDYFTAIKGIGRKGAQRIIVDLKSKLGSLGELDLNGEFKFEVDRYADRFGIVQ